MPLLCLLAVAVFSWLTQSAWDTVVDDASDQATGFVFDAATPGALAQAVLRAVQLRADPDRWLARVRRAMAQPLGWAGPARQYLDLYRTALGRPRGSPGN